MFTGVTAFGPKDRPDPKPSLDAVISQAQLESKVAEYLRNSQMLQDYSGHPITAEQLQGEMDRMAQHTKQPELLRKLFEALGNDPFVIAECLARPALAERLLSNQYDGGQREPLEPSPATSRTPTGYRDDSAERCLHATSNIRYRRLRQ